ncbi:transposase, partial [Bacteroides sp. HMSC073E02]
MEELKKKYTPYTESERMSYIREYLSTSETKYQFAKRTGICRRLLILWLDKYHINDKVMSTEQPSLRKDSDESLNELEKELAALRAENRKLQRALQEESLRHEA